MALVFAYSPTTQDTNYETFNNPANTITNAGFVDTGARTNPVPERSYLGGAIIYGGVVSADGTKILGTAAPPDTFALTLVSNAIARTRPPSDWGITELKLWASQHPGATIYVVHQ